LLKINDQRLTFIPGIYFNKNMRGPVMIGLFKNGRATSGFSQSSILTSGITDVANFERINPSISSWSISKIVYITAFDFSRLFQILK
jgi:hypothetical protein